MITGGWAGASGADWVTEGAIKIIAIAIKDSTTAVCLKIRFGFMVILLRYNAEYVTDMVNAFVDNNGGASNRYIPNINDTLIHCFFLEIN